MQQPLTSRSPDLKRLVDEGYEVEIYSGHLLLRNIPYVTPARTIKRGTLVSVLNMAGDVVAPPVDHVALFAGEMPCDPDGQPLSTIIIGQGASTLADGLVTNVTFSSKPSGGYSDYYHKMSTYAAIISRHAQRLDPSVTARTFALIESSEVDTVFKYIDTASSRSQIGGINDKLKIGAIAIVGLGGTGSYILDMVAKTPIKDIHLFDGDILGQHNAFRSPGAVPIESLKTPQSKVDYFKSIYSQLRDGIHAHGYIDEDTVALLQNMDFVFISIDKSHWRKLLVDKLEDFGVPFIDVGMGVIEDCGTLLGQLRVTLSTDATREPARRRLPLSNDDVENEYDRNIQIVELNALNAALAVVRWKKHMGFYIDITQEHTSLYQIDSNFLVHTSDP